MLARGVGIVEKLARRRRVRGSQAAERERRLVRIDGDAVQLDRAQHRLQADRHQAALPRVAHRDDVGDDRVADELLRQALRVHRLDALGAGGELDLVEQRVDAQVGVGVRDRLGDRDLVPVREHARAAVAHGLQRIGGRGDDDVAREHRVGLLRVDAHLVERRLVLGEADEREHRAALLREAHEVEHARGVGLEVRGHRDQRADRDDARAADAGDEQVVRAGPSVRRRQRQPARRARRSGRRRARRARPVASSAGRRRCRRSSGRSPSRTSSPCCSSTGRSCASCRARSRAAARRRSSTAPSSRRSLRRRGC